MNFIEAIEPLKNGKKIKKKNWGDYWDKHAEVWMTKYGDLMINHKITGDTDPYRIDNVMKDEWVILDN